MASYLFIILGAVLVNNVVLVRILGLCPFMGVSKKLETAVGMGAATTFVLTLGCGTSYVIDSWLLIPNNLEYLRTLAFIVTIAAIVQLTELVIQKTSPVLHQVLGIYLPLITTNCAVLGIPLLNITQKHGFFESLLFGFGSSLGFTLALVLFAGVRERLDEVRCKHATTGADIGQQLLLTAGRRPERTVPIRAATDPSTLMQPVAVADVDSNGVPELVLRTVSPAKLRIELARLESAGLVSLVDVECLPPARR